MKAVILVFWSALVALGVEEEERFRTLNDFDRRVATFVDTYLHLGERPMTSDPNLPYWKEWKWYNDQGADVRPALLYLLREGYSGDYGQLGTVIHALMQAPGSKWDVVDYVKKELPKMLDQEATDDTRNFTCLCLMVLGGHGGPDEIALLEAFEDNDDPVVKSAALTQGERLRKRIERGAFSTRAPIGARDSEARSGPSSKEVSGNAEKTSPDGAVSRFSILVATSILLLALILLLGVRVGRRSSGRRP